MHQMNILIYDSRFKIQDFINKAQAQCATLQLLQHKYIHMFGTLPLNLQVAEKLFLYDKKTILLTCVSSNYIIYAHVLYVCLGLVNFKKLDVTFF